jgi:RraA family protein
MTTTTTAWPAGFVLNDRVDGPPADIVAGFREIPTANISDAIGRVTGAVGLIAYGGGEIMAGPAVTVRVRPGDNLMIHKSLDLVQPGDVLVIDAGGSTSQAVIGGNMRMMMIQRGLSGVIVDGAIRDAAEFLEPGLPTLAKGVNHRGPAKDGPGEINVPISCAGMAVMPGDIVVGDLDGAVVVPRAQAEAILAAARAVVDHELELRAVLDAGTIQHGRFDSILRSKGCPV